MIEPKEECVGCARDDTGKRNFQWKHARWPKFNADSYNDAELAAIARAHFATKLWTSNDKRLMLPVSFIAIGLLAFVFASYRNSFGLPFVIAVGLSLHVFMIAYHMIRGLAPEAINMMVGAGLCGKCGRQLEFDVLPDNHAASREPMAHCNHCNHAWRASRLHIDTSPAAGVRRKRTSWLISLYTRDASRRHTILAAGFAGLTEKEAASSRGLNARALARQIGKVKLRKIRYYFALVIGLFLITPIIFFLFTLYGPLSSFRLVLMFPILFSGHVAAFFIFIVAVPRLKDRLIRNWIRQGRCPCCDANLAHSGKWNEPKQGVVRCTRCESHWKQPLQNGSNAAIFDAPCALCGYSLEGLEANALGNVTCPECDSENPAPSVALCRLCMAPLDLLAHVGPYTGLVPQDQPQPSNDHQITCAACQTLNLLKIERSQ